MGSADRAALRELLAQRAFLDSHENSELRDRNGAPLPWIFYGGDVSLSASGARLMGAVLLDALAGFRSTQLATYGVSAIPALTATIMAGAGRYSGLVIRKERKQHGSGRRIDGAADRSRPVVVVDESISSGLSVYEAVRALEAEGLEVEGAVCLVEFSGYGAVEWLSARGYRIETVFDVWRDLRPSQPRRHAPPDAALLPWSGAAAPEQLSAAQLARHVAEGLSRTGRLCTPPARLDRAHDARGGTFVSIRMRDGEERVARGGFRRDGAEEANASADVVLATHEAMRLVRDPLDLDRVKFSVSFLGATEPIEPGGIDHERHALVVRGLGPLDRVGFALPNAPHYDDEIEQYRYARSVGGNFWDPEPHALFRQPVERIAEPDLGWPPYGAPREVGDWTCSERLATSLARRVQQILDERLAGTAPAAPIELPSPPEPIHGVGVSLYRDGLAGCALSLQSELGPAIEEATVAALRDGRYTRSLAPSGPGPVVAVVSLLRRRRRLGQLSPDRLPLFFRLGRDTLEAATRDRRGLVLAHFAVQQSLDRGPYAEQVLRKAHLDTASRPYWTAYETTSWACSGGSGRRFELGFPVRAPLRAGDEATLTELAREVAGFVLDKRMPDGLPAYQARAWTGELDGEGTATRILIAVTGLIESAAATGALDAARAMVERFLAHGEPGTPAARLRWDHAADAQLLRCLSLLGDDEAYRPAARKLVGRLVPLMRADGAIHAGGANRMASDLDLLSGSVLLALAGADSHLNPDGALYRALDRALGFYRRRFRLARPWGMVWWHAQAWAALAGRVEGAADFVFELVDWALARQSERSGAFVIDRMEPRRLSALSACVLEGVADAARLAAALGDDGRARRYSRAWERGIEFVQRLVIREGDAFFSPRPERMRGGVRTTLASADARIDFAGHLLIALGKGMRMGAPPAAARQAVTSRHTAGGESP